MTNNALIADIGRSHAKIRWRKKDQWTEAIVPSPIGTTFDSEELIHFLETILLDVRPSKVALSLAGMRDINQKKDVIYRLKNDFRVAETFIHTDAEVLLNATDVHDERLIFITGTGSIVLGNMQDKNVRLFGFGPLIGDPGSAFTVGRSIIVHLLGHQHDPAIASFIADISSQLGKDLKRTDRLTVSDIAWICIYFSKKSDLDWLHEILDAEIALVASHLKSLANFEGTIFVEGGMLEWDEWRSKITQTLGQILPKSTIKIKNIQLLDYLQRLV